MQKEKVLVVKGRAIHREGLTGEGQGCIKRRSYWSGAGLYIEKVLLVRGRAKYGEGLTGEGQGCIYIEKALW